MLNVAIAVLATSFAFLVSPDASAETVAIPVKSGGELKADFAVPQGMEKVPAVLIAPGRSYHRGAPLIEGLASLAPANGWASLRFDWRYYSADPKQGKPSKELVSEREDLAAAAAFLRAHPRIDASRIVVVGKSLGSVVAGQVFAEDGGFRAVMLLTPVCTDPSSTPRYYGRRADDKRPIVMVLGDADPACPLLALQDWARGERTPVAIVTLPGDHGFHVESGPKASPRDERNVRQATAIAAHWIADILERKP